MGNLVITLLKNIFNVVVNVSVVYRNVSIGESNNCIIIHFLKFKPHGYIGKGSELTKRLALGEYSKINN